jgi:AraC-like DNA-binding protein
MPQAAIYNPVQDGIAKTAHSVRYREVKPPSDLSDVVHCFWELKTVAPLPEDFHLHAVPDACVNLLFNQMDTSIAGITALRTTYAVLNLGNVFHYVGIQLLPGVWHGKGHAVADHFVGTPYTGALPLIDINHRLAGLDFLDKPPVMATLVRHLATENIVAPNRVMLAILTHLDDIHTVADMAAISGLSPRHLQRTLKQTTGFSPHDLLKILRLQQSFEQGYPLLYADQSHFIRSFRAITGYTPTQYFTKFDV